MKYYNYHKHDHKGNPIALDVVSKFEDYCKRAVELGHDAVFTTNHGMQGDIFEATTLAHQYNLKLIVGAELYYVPNRKEKDRSNRHIILIALNHEGIRELNNIISEANESGFYYKPRIDEELLFSLTPENFVITTACVAGLWSDENLIIKLKQHFGFNFFLEVQNHNMDIQKEVNRTVLELSKKHNIKIIHANDSHYIYPEEKKECDKVTINNKEYELLPANRDLFLRAKGIIYEEESNFILDYPDYDEIIKRYEIQGVLNKNQIKEALDNTLIFENIDCSDYINDDIKLPSVSKNPNEELKEILNKSWEINKQTIPLDKRKEYLDAIRYEYDIIEKTNMADYFLIDYNIAKIAKEKYNGVLTKTGRGSAPSFYITNLLHLTNIDRLKSPIKLFPTRFMSVERILGTHSIPDIDLNSADAEPFIKASEDLLGKNNCAWMISWKPLQEASGFRLYCKAIGMDINDYNEVAKDLDKYKNDPIWNKVIESSKPFIGVVEGISESPCSICLGTTNLRREVGLIKTPNNKICCMLDGYNCDKYKYLKNDYLTVTVWAIIRDVCNLANIDIPTIEELNDLLDDKTFDIYAKGLTCSINQADSDYATGLVMKYKPKSLAEMSAFVAIIRPGCASLLNDFIERKPYTTNVKALDDLLEDSEHRLIYQESIMKYLIWLGIPESQSYDIIKKIAKKKFKEKELEELKASLLKGWKEQVGEDNGFEETWQVVEDAAKYSFNCIAGSTKIQRLGQKKSCFNPTIEEMYLIKNDKNYAIKTGHKNLHMKYKKYGYGNAYSMFEDNRIHKNKIIDIYYTGIQKIYRVKTKKGSYVDCTMSHKFPTPTGEKKLQDLTVGSELYTKSIYEKHPDDYRLTNGVFKSNIPKKGQKGFQVVEDGESHKFMLVYNEKKENKCPCELCYKNFDNSKFELHHINHDRTNNNRENLQWLCNSCHKKQHYKDGRIKVLEKGIPTLIDEIESITYLREDKVYDIEMQNPAHNFVSESGLVVSNCSHSLSYAYDSLYGAYLKSHYPLEYYTVALNYYQDDADRTTKLIKELAFFNISLKKPKFRYSKANYFMDRNTNTIYKGTGSIKYLNSDCSNYLYSLRDNTYPTFIDLLKQIEEDKQINSRQMEILIQLQYFDEFGKNKKLLELYRYFKDIYGRKTLVKTKINELGITIDDIVDCFDKETEKQYTNINSLKILENIEKRIPNEIIPLQEQITFEMDVIGYISAIYDVDKNICIAVDVDTKYSPKINLYSLGTGKEVGCKINKAIFNQTPFKRGQLIKCGRFYEKFKQRKTENGWEQTNIKEWWLESYELIEDLKL